MKERVTKRIVNSDWRCSHYYSWKFDGVDAGDFATVYASSYRHGSNRFRPFWFDWLFYLGVDRKAAWEQSAIH
jgi:hypothetical protein